MIIGKLIPAATGLRRYRRLEIEPSEPLPRPTPEEIGLLDESELAAELGLTGEGLEDFSFGNGGDGGHRVRRRAGRPGQRAARRRPVDRQVLARTSRKVRRSAGRRTDLVREAQQALDVLVGDADGGLGLHEQRGGRAARRPRRCSVSSRLSSIQAAGRSPAYSSIASTFQWALPEDGAPVEGQDRQLALRPAPAAGAGTRSPSPPSRSPRPARTALPSRFRRAPGVAADTVHDPVDLVERPGRRRRAGSRKG